MSYTHLGMLREDYDAQRSTWKEGETRWTVVIPDKGWTVDITMDTTVWKLTMAVNGVAMSDMPEAPKTV